MQRSGDSLGADYAHGLPTGFKYMVGAAALFIAGCSAFFSVRGLGLLFVGSATAVMIMAASLEVGKLVAASFLYRYWNVISRSLRFYLLVAVIGLIGITSLGNYGYLTRAYERTHTTVSVLEHQITALEAETADIQRQIDAARGQLGQLNEAGRADLTQAQDRLTQANASFDQTLARLQEKRQTAQARYDNELQLLAQRQADRTAALKQSIASAEAAATELNDRVAVLDRAVDAYTQQGGPGFFKVDSIKKGQELRDKQRAERERIAASMATHRERQETLRAELNEQTKLGDAALAALRQQFDTEIAAITAEEKEARTAQTATVKQAEKQLAALASQGQTAATVGGTQIDALYQRLRSRQDEIRQLRDQIAATDIGSYRFVARAFEAQPDDVVKWLTLALVLVFDPLAVSLAVGFNVAVVSDPRRRRRSDGYDLPGESGGTAADLAGAAPARRSRLAAFGASLLLLVLITGGLALGGHWGWTAWRDRQRSAQAELVPADSFAVLTLQPAGLTQSSHRQNLTDWLGALGGGALTETLQELQQGGFDPQANVYAFAKFPQQPTAAPGERPVLLCGLVAQVNDPAAAESTLARVADRFSRRVEANPTARGVGHNRAMIQHGNGRYLDPEGGFFTFAMTGGAAILMIELEGNPQSPCIEKEIQAALVPATTGSANATARTAPALRSDGVLALWVDAARFFERLPKNAAAETRRQQLGAWLDFELTLQLYPQSADELQVMADYSYQGERFKDRQQPTALAQLAKLGSADDAGLCGRLMDRCADTLDYDSLIARLRTVLTGSTPQGAQEVLVEKSFTSSRDGQFVLTARYNPQAGAAPVAAATPTLFQ